MNIIREAVSRLPGHWSKGAYEGPDGTHCGLGHIQAAYDAIYGKDTHYSWNAVPALNQIRHLMAKVAREQFPERAHNPDGMCSFVRFNDHPDTTESDVILVMEKAAVQLDELL